MVESLYSPVLNHLSHDADRLLDGHLGDLDLLVLLRRQAGGIALALRVQPLKRVGHVQLALAAMADDVLHLAAVRLVELDLHGLEGDAGLAHAAVALAEHDFAHRDRLAVVGRRGGNHVCRQEGAADEVLSRADLEFETLPDLFEGKRGCCGGWVDRCRVRNVVCGRHLRSGFGGTVRGLRSSR